MLETVRTGIKEMAVMTSRALMETYGAQGHPWEQERVKVRGLPSNQKQVLTPGSAKPWLTSPRTS